MDRPFTYSEWFCKLRPACFVPDHSGQLVHVDNDDYNRMKYKEYLDDYKNINKRQLAIEKELLDTINRYYKRDPTFDGNRNSVCNGSDSDGSDSNSNSQDSNLKKYGVSPPKKHVQICDLPPLLNGNKEVSFNSTGKFF